MEDIIKSKDRVEKYGEVFTPQWMVEMMCDQLEELNPGAFEPKRTFLEPTCGDGAFILEILRRKFVNCKSRKDYTISIESVYGFELLEDNVESTIKNVIELCEKHFKLSKSDRGIINDHIIQCDALKVLKLLQVYGDNPPEKIYIFNKGVRL